VVMIEETLRSYRLTFYERLHAALAERGRQFFVTFSPQQTASVSRGDAHEVNEPWSLAMPSRQVLRVRGKSITYQSLNWPIASQISPLVIVNQAVSNIENFSLVASHSLGRIGLATWGHGRTYSVPASPPMEWAKRRLTMQSDWFFAYTHGGADHVTSYGFPASHISVVHNSIDSLALRAHLQDVTDEEVRAFRDEHCLTSGQVGLYLGGVDEKKGIQFLLESIERLRERLPRFRLLVGGSGALDPLVREAQLQGAPVEPIGRLDGSHKALALACSNVMCIPEWIGLVAVDSLVSGTPIVTTRHSSHSCEVEYLTDTRNCWFTDHDPDAYAQGIIAALSDEGRLHQVTDTCLSDGKHFSIERMVESFSSGIDAWDELRTYGLTGRGRRPTVHQFAPERRHEEQPTPVSVAVLITCHNRREKTLACLTSLLAQAGPHVRIHVVLVDDGSSDGTADAIAELLPEVEVIAGSGNLYWAGGMAVAERRVQEASWDYLLWLNDDVTLASGAIGALIETSAARSDAIVVGLVEDPVTHLPSYGALAKSGQGPLDFAPAGATESGEFAAFNGNVVLIPVAIRRALGPIDGALGHAYADIDYGLRATAAGFSIVQTPGPVGTCVRNHGPKMPRGVRQRWRFSQDPTYQPWRSQMRFLRRHGRADWFLRFCAGYGRILFGWRK
jgi:GT2 family glycosyltransferase